jgi:DNA-binding NarL/FixJ family response regulator
MTYTCASCGHVPSDHQDGRCFGTCACAKPCVKITPRELDIFRSLARGGCVKDTTDAEHSLKTTEAHKYNLMRKLGVHNKIELTALAIRLGIISIDDIPVPDVVLALPQKQNAG